MSVSRHGIKRYNLQLPMALFDKVQKLADNRETTVVEEIRKAVTLWLIIATNIAQNPNIALVLRDNDKERELMLLELL